jgi:hypothetical protein
VNLQGVLITGAYGTGKSSVVEEIAGLLEDAGVSYGAIDLDWLMWFDADVDDARREKVFLANLAAVISNYIDTGVERLLIAGAIRDEAALAAVRGPVPIPLCVVRLSVPLPEIEARLRAAVTAGRKDDLRVAKEWVADSTGVGIEDITVANDRPIRETALEIIEWLGWSQPAQG